jgi:Transposase DDE domain group 1
LLAALVGKTDPTGQDRLRPRDQGKPLAGKSTRNRLELTPADATAAARDKKIVADADAIDRLFVEVLVQAHATPPTRIVLDLDATEDPLHGHQEGRFFHGYYGEYCYLPLYIFCGEQLLCARLPTADHGEAHDALEELVRIITQIRAAGPHIRILVRGDSGFCRDEIMAWCEAHDVDYLFGLAKNSRLLERIEPPLADAHARYLGTAVAARLFVELRYRTRDSWSCERRVVAKAEWLAKGANPRFVVTSLTEHERPGQALYEEDYGGRGDLENRIKEQQLWLFAERTSTALLPSNQLPLYFSSVAYLLLSALRRLGLAGTEMANAPCGTMRLRLLKIGALVRVTVRRVWVSLASSYAWREVFAGVYANLRGDSRPSVAMVT